MRGIPKFGFLTTSRIVEDIIILLKDYGCTDITIGEGTVLNKELGSNTKAAFKWSGMKKVAKRYGVKMKDFHEDSVESFDFEGNRIEIYRSVLDAEFLIDIPVLKTHYQAQISLGIKNLKGCISMKSRSVFHKKDLPRLVAALGTKIIPDLTIIDGTYGLERGPGPLGRAHRMDIIIAGRDVLSCDIVGTRIMGLDPAKITQLKNYAEMTNRSLKISTIDIRGEKIGNVKKPMEWELDHDTIIKQAGIEGFLLQKPGSKVCTGCATNLDSALIVFCTDNSGQKFDNIEVCAGSSVIARKESNNVILFGNCAINANKDRKDAVRIKGCPGKLSELLIALTRTQDKRRARKVLLKRLLKTLGTKLRIYNEDLLQKGYTMPEYDNSHF
jgi:uncharacterized protein (DUF362 family)